MPFCEEIFPEGNINTLLGPPGSGKTNCALFLTEKAIDYGFFVYTNIHFFKYSKVAEACNRGLLPKGVRYRPVPPEIVVVTSLSELLLGLLSTEKNVVVLDESGIFASSTAPMSKKVRELKELAYVIRHLRSSLLLIAQSKGSIAPALRSELVTYELRIRKISKFFRTLTVKKAMAFTNDAGEEDVEFIQIGPTIGKIPLTRYPWDGFFIPRFVFDIKLEDAFNELGKTDSLEVREKDSDGKSYGEKVIRKLMESNEEKEEGGGKTGKQLTREQARNQFLTYAESGEFDKRSDILAKLANDNGKTYNWAYQICRDLPFGEE